MNSKLILALTIALATVSGADVDCGTDVNCLAKKAQAAAACAAQSGALGGTEATCTAIVNSAAGCTWTAGSVVLTSICSLAPTQGAGADVCGLAGKTGGKGKCTESTYRGPRGPATGCTWQQGKTADVYDGKCTGSGKTTPPTQGGGGMPTTGGGDTIPGCTKEQNTQAHANCGIATSGGPQGPPDMVKICAAACTPVGFCSTMTVAQVTQVKACSCAAGVPIVPPRSMGEKGCVATDTCPLQSTQSKCTAASGCKWKSLSSDAAVGMCQAAGPTPGSGPVTPTGPTTGTDQCAMMAAAGALGGVTAQAACAAGGTLMGCKWADGKCSKDGPRIRWLAYSRKWGA